MDEPMRPNRTARIRRALPLVLADLAIVGGLIVAGQMSHGMDPLGDPLVALKSILPFAIGWLVVTTAAGTYTGGRALPRVASPHTIARTAVEVSIYWLAGANVGFLLRGSDLFPGGVPWEFTVVLTGLGLVALVGWRVLLVLVFADRLVWHHE